MATLSIGPLALFAGGWNGAYSDRVDIYDSTTAQWSTAALALPRSGVAATAAGTRAIFAGGGIRRGRDVEPPDWVEVFDSATGEWSRAELPMPVRDLSAVTVGTKARFVGLGLRRGWGWRTDIYDSATGTWSEEALPDGLGWQLGRNAITIGGLVVFFGRSDGTIHIWDSTADEWRTAQLSQAREHYAVATVGTKILFAGGLAPGYSASDIVDIHDTVTGEWTASKLSQARTGLAATAVRDLALFAGGVTAGAWSGPCPCSDVVDIYDSRTGEWSRTSLGLARTGLAATTVGDTALFVGGFAGSGGYTDFVDLYDAASASWMATASEQPAVMVLTLREVPTGTVGLAEGDSLTLTWESRLLSGTNRGFSLTEVRDAVTLPDGTLIEGEVTLAAMDGRMPAHKHVLSPQLGQKLAGAAASKYQLRRSARWTNEHGQEATATGTITVLLDVAPPPPATPPLVAAWYYLWACCPEDDLALAEQAGLDALIVSESLLSADDVIHSRVLEGIKGTSLRVTIGIEPEEKNKYPTREAAAERLKRVVEFAHAYPRWLRLEGRPILVFWRLPAIPTALGERPQDAWEWIREQVDPEHTTIWIAEGGDPNPTTGTLSYLRSSAFDGLHLYSISWAADPGQALASWAARLRSTGQNRVWAATVMPGGAWDDFSKTPVVRYYRDRQAGLYYTRAWEGAVATTPDLIVITSWNEFPEMSAIRPEPTKFTFDYGTRYVDLTRQLAAQAKAHRADGR